MPDGTPASKAELTFAEIHQPSVRVQTNESASFEFSAPCLGRAKLIAKLPDGSLQRCVHISPVNARTQQSTPIQITLHPAQQMQVNVTADDQPVVGVQISTDENLLVSATTNEKGAADLLVPAGAGEFILTAWHPKSGTSGSAQKVETVSSGPMTVKLKLSPIASQKVQILDEHKERVVGLPCTANGPFSFAGWFRGSSFPNLIRTTDSDGIVEFDYVYPGIKVVDIELQDHQWVLNQCPVQIDDPAIIPHVQAHKRHSVTGKITAPAGTPLEGLLVIARSQPTASDNGDTTTARADRLGNFTMGLTTARCYLITIDEPQWTSDPLIGVLQWGSPGLPNVLELHLKPTIPFTIFATAGPKNEPLADAQVIFGRPVEWTWYDWDGQEHSAGIFLRSSATTDSQGKRTVDLAPGKNMINVIKGEWSESRELDAKTEAARDLKFHAQEISPPKD